jgi:hypothetical protein
MVERTLLGLLISALGGAILSIAGIVSPALARDAHFPQEVRVVVYNGSGRSGAAQSQLEELRGLGFDAQLSKDHGLSIRKVSMVACRRGFKADAENLSVIIPGARLVKLSATGVAREDDVDCIVVLGSESPLGVTVAVFNAAGEPNADVAVVADLRSDYYDVPVNGPGRVPQIGTTVTCRPGLEEHAEALAERLEGSVAPFPASPTWEYTDCVVTVGQDVPGN